VRRKTLVSRFVTEKLHPVLSGRGFRRTASTWNREVNGFTQVINLQASMFNVPSSEKFTINLGVYWDRAYTIYWQRPSPKYARDVDCILRTRIGDVLEDNFAGRARDVWWTVSSEEDLERVGADVPAKVVDEALPFLDRFRSLRDIDDFLASSKGIMPAPVYYAVVLRNELGDRAGAIEALRLMAGTSESSRIRAEELASQLGLEFAYA
jgi:hypothetical protein